MAYQALVVEDDTSFRKVLEIRLRAWNPDIKIHFAESILEARRCLESGDKYDLAILDHHLPDGLGTELFDHPRLTNVAVLAVSSDSSPMIPAASVKAGAQHFLGKRQVSEPLFVPLIEALITRKELEEKLLQVKLEKQKMESIKVLLATLRHEINNPLGAVLGAAYLVRSSGELDKEQSEALALIEASGQRIKHVLEQLCQAAELEEVVKAQEHVFQIPGDKAWD